MTAEPPRLKVVSGGRKPLDSAQSEAVQRLAGLIRGLPDQQARNLLSLAEALDEAGVLSGLRAGDVPAIRILAEVVRGWDPEGVAEFARAWVSTLVARDDGFDWERSTLEEKEEQRRRVAAAMAKRGLR